MGDRGGWTVRGGWRRLAFQWGAWGRPWISCEASSGLRESRVAKVGQSRRTGCLDAQFWGGLFCEAFREGNIVERGRGGGDEKVDCKNKRIVVGVKDRKPVVSYYEFFGPFIMGRSNSEGLRVDLNRQRNGGGNRVKSEGSDGTLSGGLLNNKHGAECINAKLLYCPSLCTS